MAMIDVRHIAKLASLPLSDSEIPQFEKQLSEVLEYVKKLDELDTTAVESTSQVTGLENVLREDVTEASLTQEVATSQARKSENGYIVVPGILDTE